jgi:hypothetical protein
LTSALSSNKGVAEPAAPISCDGSIHYDRWLWLFNPYGHVSPHRATCTDSAGQQASS